VAERGNGVVSADGSKGPARRAKWPAVHPLIGRVLILGPLVAATLAIGACGHAGRRSSSRPSTATAPSATAASPAATTSARAATTASGTTAQPLAVPRGAVAIVAGAPIPVAEFNHWQLVAAKFNSTEHPGQPVISPIDPPAFSDCIARLRKQVPALASNSPAQLRSDCAQLFRALTGETLSFLITARWYQAEAARLHNAPTAAQIDQALRADERQSFSSRAQYQSFLRKTGQTDADVRFRVAINLTYRALLARQAGSAGARTAAVTREVRQRFLSRTLCAAQYVMADCSNYGPQPQP
jgi:hypothetical protein